MKAALILLMSFVSTAAFAVPANKEACSNQLQARCEVAKRCVLVNQPCLYKGEYATFTNGQNQHMALARYTMKQTLNCLAPSGNVAVLEKLEGITDMPVYQWSDKATAEDTVAACQSALQLLVATYGACK